MVGSGQICAAAPLRRDPVQAVAEVHETFATDTTELVVLFCSSRYDRAVPAREIADRFGATRVIGRTTAGEVSLAGYREGSIGGFALDASDFAVDVEVIDALHRFEHRDGERVAASVRSRLEARRPGVHGSNTFGFLLIDGLGRREEPVTGALHSNLVDIPLFGGSAGGDMAFASTGVLADGEFRSDRGVLALVRTDRPIRAFRRSISRLRTAAWW